MHTLIVGNFASRFTFPIFKRGLIKEIDDDDIYEILQGYKSSKIGKLFEDEWKRQKHMKNAVIRMLLGVFGKQYLICGLVQCVVRTTFM